MDPIKATTLSRTAFYLSKWGLVISETHRLLSRMNIGDCILGGLGAREGVRLRGAAIGN